jgi:hypothetical protein
MQSRVAPLLQVSGQRPAQRPSRSDRECPLDTAGDRCSWHVGGTAGENDDAPLGDNGYQLLQRVRPVLGDHHLVGTSPEGSRQPDGETRTCGGKARCLLELLWYWRTLELSRAFPLAATAGRDGQPLPTGWK